MTEENQEIRWKQRFNNYLKAFQTLAEAVELSEQRELSDLEKEGLIQRFEYTHELAWKVLKDYLKDKGFANLLGSKDVTREAFKSGLIEEGDDWMDMIKARNKTSHTYGSEEADAIFEDVVERFYPALATMARKFTAFYEQKDDK